ncbi:DUF3097 domain-containing protein [Microbacteriaceae bacterium VKM Ac-2855]|nr:DUF3097 domain-containing protein [Microbacteriaceae bacterium VKM Ac-2855]
MNEDRYGQDVLAGDWRAKNKVVVEVVAAERDLVVEEVTSGFVGAVVGVELRMVQLEDRHGKVRVFPLGPGFLIDGKPVSLKAPGLKRDADLAPGRSASGSIYVPDAKARVALPSRIYVEGKHDAELVEKVWGHDLRVEGVVVEFIEGVDNLDELVRAFKPGRGRKIGVLVDHLVPNSKESRIADAVAAGPYGAHVLVVGHPYVDIWQAVKPERVGLQSWPTIPRNIEWKKGICRSLGWPAEEQADIARAWQRILSRVSTFKDLEPALLGRVEQLIDFVTDPA